MQKVFLSFVFVCFIATVYGQQINLDDARKSFNKGVKDEELCEKHYNNLKKLAKSPLEKGYEAAYTMFMANHTINPIKKMSYFKSGKEILEDQIDADPNGIELRFIRLCIQHHIPSFLGYKENLKEDKDFLVSNFHKLPDDDNKTLLFNYLKGAKIFNASELDSLTK